MAIRGTATPNWWMTPEGSGNFPGAGFNFPSQPAGQQSDTQAPGGSESQFFDFLGEEPRLGFFGQQERFGKSPMQQEFWKGQFQDVHQEFLGKLGKQIMGGGEPTLRFADFMKNFDFQRRFRSLPPSFRGAQTARFAPPTRFMF